ncbi:hypothetical protein JHW43_007381 [Diplocarpon mali]|nr:hypothetical protein JHW43_007381 [Diplocarpon mali]
MSESRSQPVDQSAKAPAGRARPCFSRSFLAPSQHRSVASRDGLETPPSNARTPGIWHASIAALALEDLGTVLDRRSWPASRRALAGSMAVEFSPRYLLPVDSSPTVEYSGLNFEPTAHLSSNPNSPTPYRSTRTGIAAFGIYNLYLALAAAWRMLEPGGSDSRTRARGLQRGRDAHADGPDQSGVSSCQLDWCWRARLDLLTFSVDLCWQAYDSPMEIWLRSGLSLEMGSRRVENISTDLLFRILSARPRRPSWSRASIRQLSRVLSDVKVDTRGPDRAPKENTGLLESHDRPSRSEGLSTGAARVSSTTASQLHETQDRGSKGPQSREAAGDRPVHQPEERAAPVAWPATSRGLCELDAMQCDGAGGLSATPPSCSSLQRTAFRSHHLPRALRIASHGLRA